MFTPFETTAGAILLHLATTRLLFDAGAILGASGLLHRLPKDLKNDGIWSPTTWFFGGMAAAVGLTALTIPQLLPQYPTFSFGASSILTTAVTGFLTGWGTKHCGGCTSGHMLCGIGRLSPRSILATAIFFPTAVATFHFSHPSLETTVCNNNLVCYAPGYPSLKTIGVVVSLLSLVFGLTLAHEKGHKRKVPPDQGSINKTYSLAGLAFGLGLLISSMASPSKVQSFFAIRFRPFDLSHWDPSMSLIILFALIPNIVSVKWRGLKKPPRLASHFSLPTKTIKDVDSRFFLGAIAFGVSWGLTGVCPGPAILRIFLQPAWGVLWMTSFYTGSLDIFG